MKQDFRKFSRLCGVIRGRLPAYFGTTLLVAGRNYAITWLTAYIGAEVIDRVVGGMFAGVTGTLLKLLSWLAVFLTLDTCAQYAYAQTMHRVTSELRGTLFRKLLHAPLSAIEKLGTRGDALTRMNEDAENARGALGAVLMPLMFLISGIGATATLLTICWPLVPLLYAFGGAGILIQRALSKRTRKLAAGIQTDRADIASNLLHENTYLRELRASGLTGFSRTLLRRLTGKLTGKAYAQGKLEGLAGLADGVETLAGSFGILFAALPFYRAGYFELHGFVYLYTMSGLILTMLNTIGTAFRSFQSAMAGVDRVFTLLELPDERERDCGLPEVSFGETIEARELRCVFPNGQTGFEGFNFSLPLTGFTALRGNSGAGKTTLLRLLLKLYDYDGSLTTGGRELRDVTAESLRTGMIYVAQENPLSEGSIRENLTRGIRNTDDDALYRVLTLVRAREWVDAAGGLDTHLGENAAGLSGGQRQALALATALLTDARVLLLDEVFAGIDRGRCAEILDALREEAKRIAYPARGSEERTFFIVTHDDEIAARCDRVLQI